MNPQEKVLLEQTLRLSKENNQMLRDMQSRARWATVWGFIKLMIIVVPLVLGYIYLIPYFDQAKESVGQIRTTIDQASSALNQVNSTLQN